MTKTDTSESALNVLNAVKMTDDGYYNLRIPSEDGPVHPGAVLLLCDLTESPEQELADSFIAQCRDDVEVLEVQRGLGSPG